MAEYTTVVTDAGVAKLTDIANGAGTLEWRAVKCGDGEIGVGDPEALTDIINELQSFDIVDVKLDDDGNPYIYFTCDNDGLAAGYTRWELGLFGRESGDASDTLIIYLYAETEEQADYIPPESESSSVQTFRVQLAAANGLATTVNVDQSTVFLALDRWADHLAGGGDVDQHPLATTDDPGLMSAADKTILDEHPGSGGAAHATAEASVGGVGGLAGFISAYGKEKLNSIDFGAEENQNAFAIVKVGAVNITADGKQDTIELVEGSYVTITPDAVNDKVTIEVTGVTPSTHVGSGGAQHAEATTAVAGFMSAYSKEKLNSIDYGAEVNQNAFGNVKVGAITIQADGKTDTLELAQGANITLTPDTVNDKVTIAVSGVALSTHVGAGGAEHAAASGAAAGFMSAADKSKLDGIETGAEVNDPLPYYALYSLIGSNTASTMMADGNTRRCGMVPSPAGGIHHVGIQGQSQVHCFEIQVNNVTAGDAVKTLYFPRVDDDVYYQIDDDAVAMLVDGAASNASANLTIPTGEHRVRLFINNAGGDDCCIYLADWLDDDVVWAEGGIYY